MNQSAYTIRNYRKSDFHDYARLKIEAERLQPHGSLFSEAAVAEALDSPGGSPEQNIFIAGARGEAVGYAGVVAEPAIGRAILDCWVQPEHRRRGLSTGLLDYALRRARETGARVAQVNAAKDNRATRAALSRMGFQPVRRFLELVVDIDRLDQTELAEAAATSRPMLSGEEGELARLQNLSFAGTWGYSPNTADEIRHRTSMSTSTAGDVILTFKGETIIGYCWTAVMPGDPAEEGKTGRISMLGVEPEHRGKGAGKRALLAGLAHLKNRGMRRVRLTVDSENGVALALYRSIGFRPCAASIWYQKDISQGASGT